MLCFLLPGGPAEFDDGPGDCGLRAYGADAQRAVGRAGDQSGRGQGRGHAARGEGHRLRETTRLATKLVNQSGFPLHRENKENGLKTILSGKTQGIWKSCQNTGYFVYSSHEFADSKDQGYSEFVAKVAIFF